MIITVVTPLLLWWSYQRAVTGQPWQPVEPSGELLTQVVG